MKGYKLGEDINCVLQLLSDYSFKNCFKNVIIFNETWFAGRRKKLNPKL